MVQCKDGYMQWISRAFNWHFPFHSSIGHSLGASLSGLSAGLTKSVSSLSAGAVGKVSSLSSSSSAGAFGHSSGGSSSGGDHSVDHGVDHGNCRKLISRENKNRSSNAATFLFLAYGTSDGGSYNVQSTHYNIPETHYSGYEVKPSYGPPKPTISYISEPQSAYGTPEYNGKHLSGTWKHFELFNIAPTRQKTSEGSESGLTSRNNSGRRRSSLNSAVGGLM